MKRRCRPRWCVAWVFGRPSVPTLFLFLFLISCVCQHSIRNHHLLLRRKRQAARRRFGIFWPKAESRQSSQRSWPLFAILDRHHRDPKVRAGLRMRPMIFAIGWTCHFCHKWTDLQLTHCPTWARHWKQVTQKQEPSQAGRRSKTKSQKREGRKR